MTTTAAHRAWRWFRRGGWYFPVVVASFGFLSAVPFAHAATRLRTACAWGWAALYLAATATVFVLAGSAPKDAAGVPDGGAITTLQVLLTIALWIVPCFQLRGVRRRAYRLPDPAVTDSDVHPAVAQALAARQRRADARRLAGDDPLLARDLGIGRPDLRRGYDDGGLVELNTAPAAVIAGLCEVPRDVADQIVAGRVHGTGSLSRPEELMIYLDLPPDAHDRLRDRGIVLAATPTR